MSSTYSVLCLSHDPALIAAEGNWYSPEEAEAAIRERTHGLSDHAACDLLIGRYSYPLIEVGCPGSRVHEGRRCKSLHGPTKWTERSWLQLLYHAQQEPNVLGAVTDRHELVCWTPGRLRRIAADLGITIDADRP